VSNRKFVFLDGYCSTVQGLLDWFEVDLGFTELLFIQIGSRYSISTSVESQVRLGWWKYKVCLVFAGRFPQMSSIMILSGCLAGKGLQLFFFCKRVTDYHDGAHLLLVLHYLCRACSIMIINGSSAGKTCNLRHPLHFGHAVVTIIRILSIPQSFWLVWCGIFVSQTHPVYYI